MNKFLRLFSLLIFLLCSFVFLQQNAFAQLQGTKTIPGDYATIALAVADLNTQGVGTGGVTFNVAAGHTENSTADLNITATGVTGDPIVFQKSGTGNNPLITRIDAGTLATSSYAADGDAIIRLAGTDYITFNGIDVTAASGDIEYGYYTFKPDGTNGCKNVSILNCNVTLAGSSNFLIGIYISNGPTSVSLATGVTVSAASGQNSNITIDGNTIQNINTGIHGRGGSVSAYYDDHLKIGNLTGNIIQNFIGNTTVYGVYTIYNTYLQVANNNINAAGSTSYGIFTTTATNGSVDIFSNSISLESTSALYGINNTAGGTGVDNTVNIYDNIIENCSQSNTTSANYQLLSNSGAAFRINIYGNIVRNNNKTGLGTAYFLYNNGGGASGIVKIYDNNVYNNTNVETGATYCLYSSEVSSSNKEIYNNQIYNNTAGGQIFGFTTANGTAYIYQNSIYNITSNSTATTSSAATGISVNSGTTVNIYNNFVSDIKAPQSGSPDAVRGVSIINLSAYLTKLYFNTIFLNASSSGINFGGTGVFQNHSTSASTCALEMKNNVIVNNSTPAGTGLVVAYRRSGASTTYNNYVITSNNNLFYAGIPGPSNLIFSAGTNADQFLQDFQLRVAPRESASITENPPFLNVTTAPYNLHMNELVPTKVESAGIPIPAVAFDFDGDLRNVTTPDVGADEFDGLLADLTAPVITYTPLPNTFTFEARTLSAVITDDGIGITTTGIGLPVLYWRINEGSYTAATSISLGNDIYQFTFGAGVAEGDIVDYYIVAQDKAGNITAFPFAGAGGFTTNPPAASIPPDNPTRYYVLGPPMSGTFTVGLNEFITKTGRNVYFEKRTRTVLKNLNGIDSQVDLNENSQKENPVPGDISRVEVNEVYYELMENGKPFDLNFFSTQESRGTYPTLSAATTDLNLRGASGPVTFMLVDSNYPNESYPIELVNFSGSGPSSPVLIKPAEGVHAVIPGSVDQTTATFRIGSGSYVTVDGSNTIGGTTKDLTIRALAPGANPGVHLYGSANNNILKNLIIESRNNSTSSGTLLFGSGPAACDSNIVINCAIKNIDGAVERPSVGVYFFSNNTGIGTRFTNCSVYDFSDYGFRLQGSPIADVLISGCDVYMTSPSPKSIVYGAYVSRVDNLIIEKSKFYNLLSINPTTITGIYLLGSATSGSFIIRNNFVSLSGINSIATGTLTGIDYYGDAVNTVELYFNSVYIGGDAVTAGTTYGLVKRDPAAVFQSLNNTVYSARSNLIGTDKHYAVYVSNLTAATFEMDNNNYYTDGIGGVFGYWGTADILDLTSWISTSGKDLKSISGNPGYFSGNDLHIVASSSTLNDKGEPIPGITTDIDGDIRNIPDIGADEYTYIPALVLDPTGVSAINVSVSQNNIAFTPNAANNNVVIVYNLNGVFTTPSGVPPAPGNNFAGGTLLVNSAASPFNHTGLSATTTYHYKLFSYDGADYSTGVTAYATTPCDIVTELFENFDGCATPALPYCWLKVGGTGSVSTQTSNYFSSPNCLSISSSSSTNIAMVSMPPVSNAAANTHQLRFKARASLVTGGVVQFGYLTDPLDQSTFVMINSFTAGNVTYQEHIFYPGTAAGSSKVFAFRHTGSPANSAVLIDDVYWEAMPGCPPPMSLTAVAASNSALLGWAGGSAAAWDIEYGPTPFTPSGTPTIAGVTNPYTLTGLTPETGYAYYVRANCGGGVVSSWSGPKTFTTTCGPITLFSQNFDAGSILPACWAQVSSTGTASISTTNPYSAPYSLYFHGTVNAPSVVSLPPLSNAGAGTHYLTLYVSGTTALGGIIEVGYLTNPSDAASFVMVDEVLVNTLTYQLYRAYPGTAPGANQVLALRQSNSTYLRIDDVSWSLLPDIDLSLNKFYQTSVLPAPRNGSFTDFTESFSNDPYAANGLSLEKLSITAVTDRSSEVNNTIICKDEVNFTLSDVTLKGVIKNLGSNPASYILNYSVNGVPQPQYNGPSVPWNGIDTATLTYTPTERGTFLVPASITVTGDEVPDNNSKTIRLRIYPDNYTRTMYDRGDNTADTYVGWGSTYPDERMKAGVRFTAASNIKLAGVDFVCRTETVVSGEFMVQVRGAGATTTAPGALLYTRIYTAAGLFEVEGDLMYFPFGDDAPVIAAGSDYWITVKAPPGVFFPAGVHDNGFTAGRSFYEHFTDTTNWSPLVIITERAWVMRSVEVASTQSTFQVTVDVSNGWNMASVPGIHPVDQSVNTWWQYRDMGANVFNYTGGYQVAVTAAPGIGYWMKHAGARTYNTGDEWPAGGINMVPNDPINGINGWNMIGGYHYNAAVSGITTNPSGALVAGTIYGYSAGYTTATELIPGKAYWLKLNQAAQILLPAPAYTGVAKSIVNISDQWGRIILIDNSGRQYVLYAVDAETNLENFDLPPVPPVGMFDVRFGSQRYAENITKGFQSVELSGMEYPVTLRVENIGIRIQDETGKGVNTILKAGEEVKINRSDITKLLVSGDIIPAEYSLEQNYPNPFNPSCTIQFSLPEDVQNVKLTIYTALGEKVAELVNSELKAGYYQYSWYAADKASGMYIYQLQTEKFSSVKKMILMK